MAFKLQQQVEEATTRWVAHTIESASTEEEGSIRPSSGSGGNATVLEQVIEANASIPLTEVVDTESPVVSPVSFPNTKVIGWLNEKSLVLRQDDGEPIWIFGCSKRR